MRPELPRSAARPMVAGGAPAEEARPLAAPPEGLRRRDDPGGRRQASASRLMGAMARHLQDEAENDLTVESSDRGSRGAEPSSSEVKAGGGASARVSAAGAKPRRPARPAVRVSGRGAAGASASAGAADDVWAESVLSTEAAGPVVGNEGRVTAGRRIQRVEAVRQEGRSEGGRLGHQFSIGWGALVAAVAALVLLLGIGWFERLSNAEGNGPEEPTKAQPVSESQ